MPGFGHRLIGKIDVAHLASFARGCATARAATPIGAQ
jgi:hypothetical protein